MNIGRYLNIERYFIIGRYLIVEQYLKIGRYLNNGTIYVGRHFNIGRYWEMYDRGILDGTVRLDYIGHLDALGLSGQNTNQAPNGSTEHG